jgi:hypothetical protein
MDFVPWVVVFVVSLWGYRNRSLWRGGLYSVVTTGTAYIAYMLILSMMDNPIGSLAWWLALLSVVGIGLLSLVAHWRLGLLPSRKE